MDRTERLWFIVGVIFIMLLVIGVVNSFGSVTYTNVKANNTNNNGYIFVGTGTTNGGVQVGNWQDPTTIPSLKGDKGDIGSQGIAGKDGVNGLDGINGVDGKNGFNGTNGIDGENGLNGSNGVNGLDGKNGIDGLNGAKGEQGIQGETGANGKDVDPKIVTDLQNEDITLSNSIITETNNRISEDNLLQNNINTEQFDRIQLGNDLTTNINGETTQRKNADTTLNNRINDTNNKVDNLDHRVGKLEQTQYKIQTEFRVIDTKRVTISPYISNNLTRNKLDEAGVRITIKLGTSYEEREINKTNARLSAIESKIGTSAVITRTLDNKGKVKSIEINNGQLTVNGKF